MDDVFRVIPVGVVRQHDALTQIEIKKEYHDALLGLEHFSHIIVFYWFHENDTQENRAVLQVHPRQCQTNPLTGVFATHSPLRPNLIAVSICQLLSIDKTIVHIEKIDARDGSPVIDIKPYIPVTIPEAQIRLPDWVVAPHH